MQRTRERLAELGIAPVGGVPRMVTQEVWSMVKEVLADPSGRACRVWLGRQRNKVAVGALRRAALEPDDEGGARRTWADERARRIAALGLALLKLSRPTHRKGIWTSVVRGVTRGLLCALLGSPWERDRRPSIGALAGTSHDGARVGYLRALERAGFMYRQQLAAEHVEQWEVWQNRRGEAWACNRYWVIGMIPTAPLDDDEKRRLLALHHEGWEVPTEQLVRAPRPAPAPPPPMAPADS